MLLRQNGWRRPAGLDRAAAAGLAGPMLVPAHALSLMTIDTVLSAAANMMPDVISDIIGVKGSGIRDGADAGAHWRVRHDLKESR
jgi:hypothetical protein